ncbi:ParB N-terminal domain-containing protein [Streptomyces sp. NPDC094038]|uniref:ParB N-terminal domain-containing protein n=1 Tax=Streptomyces sp. NPDC094038 TaxID=3366055 RepID=UPI0038143915
MTTSPPPTRPDPVLSQVHSVPVTALAPADSPRAEDVDLAYARSLMEIGELPPILVNRRTLRVVDGMHRLTAALLAGRPEIDVRFFDGDERETFVASVRANLHHGRRLSQQERSAAARRVLTAYPEWSNRAIAQATGLSTKTVAILRTRSSGDGPQLNTRVGRDGRTRPVDPSAGRERAAAYLRAHPDASLRRIASAAGVSVGTARDVRARVERGEDPVPVRRAAASGEAAPPAAVAPADAPVRPARRRAPATDPLAALARDPSVRFSDPGRQLLRMLDNRALLGAEGAVLADALPGHCRAALIAAVHQHIDLWLAFAGLLEQTG